MSLDFDRLENRFLQRHLQYVFQTEPPRIFHVWSALTAVAGCMGRHLYLESGLGRTYGNMYVLLVGPPATKKSTAIKLSIRLMKSSTSVLFAPDDTGGQRQGLIQALVGSEEDEEDDDGESGATALDADAIANTYVSLAHEIDKEVMFINASEFGSFIGQNSLDFTRFLIKMWDGESYDYKLSKAQATLYEPLLSMLGGTTPTDIAALLPPEAIGQGFMSRIILVYAPNKEKSVPPSQILLDTKQEQELCQTFSYVWNKMRGEMRLSEPATKLLDVLYETELKLQDNRFIYYTERRASHLQKLSMVLAAADCRMEISRQDVEEGHRILTATELRMPDALGEYGLSPLSVARQKMLEYLRHIGEPVSERLLGAIMHKDMKPIDYQNAVSALVNAGKVTALDLPDGRGRALIYNDSVSRSLSQMDDDEFEALLETGKGNKDDEQFKIH